MDHDMPLPDPGASGGVPGAAVPAFVLLFAGAYLVLAHRARRRNPVQGWSRWRTAGFVAGIALLALALLPPVAAYAHHDFRGHMVQHMLIGMYAPLALVLGAPVTLLLRTLPAPGGRGLTRVLHSRPARLAAHPAVALLLSTGTLVALYVTPLYDATMRHPAGHWLLNAHFLLSGCLFAHAVAGPDPAPSRPGVRARLVCLGVAIAVHAVLSQMMYGGFWTDVHAPVDQVRGGAEIMYYGGDIAELLLAAALVATWRPDPRPRPRARGPARGVPAGGAGG
ncbi:cytochrome c oxidase assembly protein [Streptomyces sp. B1I3]|uniref:cytochrome c oxidase assembly protein n=1 Tax=Streptomyces sp. B1I3 TaxID=3042264 RepID=UPI00278A4A11|nr:cytochrome c oxidase assembly protein [Streptomyces sp. B1I3]MDQ0797976.1 putative membrane protein [Streptomyces sp. B1I3]